MNDGWSFTEKMVENRADVESDLRLKLHEDGEQKNVCPSKYSNVSFRINTLII